MDISQYLERISYNGMPGADHATLAALVKAHLFTVPFENLDIHTNTRFGITPADIYNKVVIDRRGGFCYELNLLFYHLLTQLGFNSRILSARVYDSDGKAGPQFDHMCLLVKTDAAYLVDVGFGDFSLQPIPVNGASIHDGRNFFRVIAVNATEMHAEMSQDGLKFTKKYAFSLEPVEAYDFEEECYQKQTLPDSHFVRNLICTLPTAAGRITIYNSKFIEHTHGKRVEVPVTADGINALLLTRFGIVLKAPIQTVRPLV